MPICRPTLVSLRSMQSKPPLLLDANNRSCLLLPLPSNPNTARFRPPLA